ncbi:MAG: hypothetical protein AAF633_28670, partial [Chloroflexota bacterium]
IESEYSRSQYAKTSSRSVLGSMNDFAFQFEVSIQRAGSLHSAQFPQIVSNINQTPMKGIDYKHPSHVFKSLYDL